MTDLSTKARAWRVLHNNFFFRERKQPIHHNGHSERLHIQPTKISPCHFSLVLVCEGVCHMVGAFSQEGWILFWLLIHSQLKQNNPVNCSVRYKMLHYPGVDSPATQILLCLNAQCQHTWIANALVDCECCICQSCLQRFFANANVVKCGVVWSPLPPLLPLFRDNPLASL